MNPSTTFNKMELQEIKERLTELERMRKQDAYFWITTSALVITFIIGIIIWSLK